MALKAVIDDATQIPETLKDFYTPAEDGSKFVLQVEGLVPADRLKEFRDNNINLLKERDDLVGKLKAFEGIDPKVHADLLELKKKVDTKKLIDTEGLEATVASRTEQMRQDFDGKLRALEERAKDYEGKYAEVQSRYDRMQIDRAVTDAATEAGAHPQALADIQARAGLVWKLVEGRLTPVRNGEVVYGKTAEKPMTMKEFIQDLREEAPHLFKSSSGGGAGGSGNSGTGKITNRAQLKTPAEKAKFIREHGQEKYLSLPAE